MKPDTVTSTFSGDAGRISDSELAAVEQIVRSVEGVRDAVAIGHRESLTALPLHLSDVTHRPAARARSPERSHPAPAATVAAAGIVTPQVQQNVRDAVSHGGDLPYDPDDPRTLCDVLRRAALVAGDKGIVYVLPDGSESRQTYVALVDEAQRVLRGLRALGLRPGDAVLFQFDSNRNFITAFWACVLGGFVPTPTTVPPVYTESHAAVKKLLSAWRLLNRPPVLTDAALEGALRPFCDENAMRVAVVERLAHNGADTEWQPCAPEDVVLNLLTSGSTGVPKCVQHRHGNLVARTRASIAANGFTSEEVSLNWMPLDHVGGIVMFHVRDVYLCCGQISPKIDSFIANPLAWLDWIDRHRATTTWAPNFAYALVNDRAAEIARGCWDLSSMRHILNAGEAISSTTAHRFLRVLAPHGLPHDAMRPAYGMSETSSAIVYSTMSRDDEGLGVHAVDRVSLGTTLRFVDRGAPDAVTFVEVGTPIPGVRIRIADCDDKPLPEDRIGRLQVAGPTIMKGYFDNADANASAFVGEGWFNTGDLGFLHRGRLTITGREKDLIIINGANYINQDLEAVVERLDGVEPAHVAACGVFAQDSRTEQLAIFFVPKSDAVDEIASLRSTIGAELAREVGLQPDYVVPLKREDFPKTANGKIQRGELAKALQAGRFDGLLKDLDRREENDNTLPRWFFETVWRPIAAAEPSDLPPAGTSLVFVEDSELAGALAFRESNRETVLVSAGERFERLGPRHYQLDPRNISGYRRLIDSVADETGRIGSVIHAWAYGASNEPPTHGEPEEVQFRSAFSVFAIVQALISARADDCTVLVVTTDCHDVSDEVPDCQRATIGGLVETIASEESVRRIRHVDLAGSHAGQHADIILRELRTPEGPIEVAYRDGQRFAKRLARVDAADPAAAERVLVPGTVFLMTGGLGGIGFELAQYLLGVVGIKLLIIGRSPLDTADCERARRLRDLASFGDVLYRAADVADERALRLAVRDAEELWRRPVGGVLHLAGADVADCWRDLEGHSVRYESLATFVSMFRAKVSGTFVLDRVFADRPHVPMILFSSISGTFGGTSFAAYAAASSFLEGYARSRRRAGRRVSCLAWSMWSSVGMNRHNAGADAAAHRGFESITVARGLASFLLGVGGDRPHLLIGLNPRRPRIRAWLDAPEPENTTAIVYFVAESDRFPTAALRAALGAAQIGGEMRLRFVQVRELPTDSTGAIGRDRLRRGAWADEDAATDCGSEPVTELEVTIANIWRDVLKVPRVHLRDSFFNLGGNSLRAAQLLARVNLYAGTKLPMRVLYQQPTVEGMVKALMDAREAAVAV